MTGAPLTCSPPVLQPTKAVENPKDTENRQREMELRTALSGLTKEQKEWQVLQDTVGAATAAGVTSSSSSSSSASAEAALAAAKADAERAVLDKYSAALDGLESCVMQSANTVPIAVSEEGNQWEGVGGCVRQCYGR